jgi:hypothetical protein
VIDIDCDTEGHAETGSVEMEDRNLLARTVFATADVVVVVGRAGLQGVHALSRTIGDVIASRVEPNRIVPVINYAPRSARARAEITRTIAALCAPAVGRASDLSPPAFMPYRRQVEQSHRDATLLPRQLAGGLSAVVKPMLDKAAYVVAQESEPALVVPGSLGSWLDEEAS